MAEERLQKILAHAGISSRRKGEQYILDGRVVVNGVIVTTLGTKADLDKDFIKVDGKLLRKPKRLVYVALNKPNNCVTTLEDPEGRPTVMQHIRGVRERIYPVGRLDYHSEGLLLFTNDGEFAHRLTSAAYHVPKTYLVKVNGHLSMAQELEFREGIPMHGRRTAPAGLKLIKHGINPWYEVRLIEGRQNQIRVMFKHFGRLVEKLKRVKIGFLELGPLKLGEVRHLTVAEVARFRKFLKMD
jgi:23S rRNA pseudouridine2605 synthase